MNNYDVIVLGFGGMGSSAVLSLARRGVRVLALEQFGLAHNLGSSHGEQRMIRQAYFEHSDYVPLLKHAYKYWDDLCAESGENLFHRTGLLLTGEKGSVVLKSAIASATAHQIPLMSLSHKEMKSEYPQFLFPESFEGVFEPGGGYLEIENAIKAYGNLATRHGADLRFNETVLKYDVDRKIKVVTDKAEYFCEKIVVTAGPWASALLSKLKIPLTVRRTAQFWFQTPKTFEPFRHSFPCFGIDSPNGFFYGFPEQNGVMKIAAHQPGVVVNDPRKVVREIHPEDYRELSQCVSMVLPGVRPEPVRGSVCMYTMTPDENFVIDFGSENKNVVFAAGFSGHGYKFASVIGPILADLALDGKTEEPIDFLRMRWS